MDPATQLLTTQQIADETGIAQSVIEGWVSNGEISSFKKGRLRRISRADLTDFILRHTVRAHRPDWLTPEVETLFQKTLRDMVRQELGQLQAA